MIMTLDIAQWRLYSQHVAQADFATPEAVVEHLVAMQAQDYPGALWSIGLRTQHATFESIENAIRDRKIIRTWPMRGTLHFVTARDARWITKLCGPRKLRSTASRERALDLNEAVFQKASDIISATLSEGKIATRSSLLDTLEDAGISTKNQRGYHILWNLSQRGLLCFGPHQGKQPTFVLLDEWLPQRPNDPTGNDALGELARRYFTSHGPATIKDFAGWTGLTLSDSKKGIEVAGRTLAYTNMQGIDYWHAPSPPTITPDTSFLLPGFDEFLLGYKDRSAALPPEYMQKIVPGSNGMFLPTIVMNGQVVGTWKKTVHKSQTTLHLSPFTQINTSLLEPARKRYEAFLQHPVVIEIKE